MRHWGRSTTLKTKFSTQRSTITTWGDKVTIVTLNIKVVMFVNL